MQFCFLFGSFRFSHDTQFFCGEIVDTSPWAPAEWKLEAHEHELLGWYEASNQGKELGGPSETGKSKH